jgi:hypothetical protein
MRNSLVKSNVYGNKSITFDQYPNEAWDFLSGDPDGDSDSVKKMWEAVPWLFAGVNIISQSAAEIPLALYRGNREVTSSEDWQDHACHEHDGAHREDAPVRLVPDGNGDERGD